MSKPKRSLENRGNSDIIDGGTPFKITVTAKDKRPAWKRMYQNPNLGNTSTYYNGNVLENTLPFVPGVGDAIDAVKAVDALTNKDYVTAGLLGGGLLLPNIVEKPVKAVGKVVKKAINNKGFAISTPYLGKVLGKTTAWIPFDRPLRKGISYMVTGKSTKEGLPVEYISSKYSGEAKKLYNSGINIAHKRGDKGLVVGDYLLSAPKSYSTYNHHFPDRVYLDDQGWWSNVNMVAPNAERKSVYSLEDFIKETTENPNNKITFPGAPRYRLERTSSDFYRNGGSIHIAPSKRGTFTAAASKHGMGVQEFASKVLRNKEDYSPAMVKKANFARNASKWNH